MAYIDPDGTLFPPGTEFSKEMTSAWDATAHDLSKTGDYHGACSQETAPTCK